MTRFRTRGFRFFLGGRAYRQADFSLRLGHRIDRGLAVRFPAEWQLHHEVSTFPGPLSQPPPPLDAGADEIAKKTRFGALVIIGKPSDRRQSTLDFIQAFLSQRTFTRISDNDLTARDPEDLASPTSKLRIPQLLPLLFLTSLQRPTIFLSLLGSRFLTQDKSTYRNHDHHNRHNRAYALHRIGGIAGFIRLGIFALSPLHDSPHLARRHGPSETKTNHDDQKYPHHGQILPTTLITCPPKGPAVAAAKHD